MNNQGIRQWTINRNTSFMMKSKITHYVDYNYGLKRLDTNSLESTNQNSTKESKVFEPTIKITSMKNYGYQLNLQ